MLDFISDLHLQAAEPETFEGWKAYMGATIADAVFILGDLFEVWVGDDAAESQPSGDVPFEVRCADVLRHTSSRMAVHLMHGNRDFLVGPDFCSSTGITLLDDPCVLKLPMERWVLSHGDALCLDDVDYQQFRSSVRSPPWQSAFLAKPLRERREIARQLRDQSQARKLATTQFADADLEATVLLLEQAGASHLIHGHTHKPADHQARAGLQRHVLSDWDLGARPARAQVLRLTLGADGVAAMSRIAPSKS